jgi:hypothetical protein
MAVNNECQKLKIQEEKNERNKRMSQVRKEI